MENPIQKLSERWAMGDPFKKPVKIHPVSEEYKNKVLQDAEPIKADWNKGLEVFKKLALAQKEDYVIDQENKEAIISSLKHFASDSEQGLILMGNFGSGKTTLLDLCSQWVKRFNNLKRKGFRMVSSHDVVSDYEGKGNEGIEKYFVGHWAFDDLGTEEVAKYYGKTEDVMKRVLEKRYILLSSNGLMTHLTTNHSLKELSERYGARMESRFNEMFTKIILGAKANSRDFRKITSNK
jgi:DNA replication protein DnaC